MLLLRVCLQDFSSVAEKTGTYTAMDYADIMEHLVKRWRVAERSDLTGEVCNSSLPGTLVAV
jgi:acyl-[acyl-carrier-protein] desaturase